MKKVVSVRIEKDLLMEIEKEAKSINRTRSYIINKILQDVIDIKKEVKDEKYFK